MLSISDTDAADPNTLEGRTFTLNCKGVVGDMMYLTDLDYTSMTGHCLAEVEIYGTGKYLIATFCSVVNYQ